MVGISEPMVGISEPNERRRLAYIELAEYSKWALRRDEILLNAAAVGIPKSEVALMTGLSRGHVYHILSKANGHATDAT